MQQLIGPLENVIAVLSCLVFLLHALMELWVQPENLQVNRHSLSAHTWTRTQRGPQKKWLHHIKKVDSPSCACGAAEEAGHHLVFMCPRHEGISTEFLVGKSSWEELDKADWRKVGDGEDAWYFEAVEEFFGHLYGAMTGRSASQT